MDATYISKITTENTGGGCMVDFIYLSDGRVMTLNDECVCIFESVQDFYSEKNLAIAAAWIPRKQEKKFVAYWGRGYGTSEPRIVDDKFFTEDAGYAPDIIDEILKMPVGDIAHLSDLSGEHFVMRVE